MKFTRNHRAQFPPPICLLSHDSFLEITGAFTIHIRERLSMYRQNVGVIICLKNSHVPEQVTVETRGIQRGRGLLSSSLRSTCNHYCTRHIFHKVFRLFVVNLISRRYRCEITRCNMHKAHAGTCVCGKRVPSAFKWGKRGGGSCFCTCTYTYV